MNQLSFDRAAEELATLCSLAEPIYASHLSRRLFELLRQTHELAFIFKGYPREVAGELALAKVYEATGKDRR